MSHKHLPQTFIFDRLYVTFSYLACLNLTKAVQSVSESLQSVADLYESYVSIADYRKI